MKILRIDLWAFGPFTDAALDLKEGDHGLHVVYGPNEAGKSSALRALRQMLFGIEARTADNFLHAHQDLRIGAVLRSKSGTVLECLRRKGNKNTLRGPDGESLVDPALLEAMLGNVDESTFGTQFGIDYSQLVKGGRSIADGNDLGQILFDAARGAANLQQVQQQLSAESAEIFKPSGSAPRLNVALRNLADVRKQVKEAQLPSAQWLVRDKSLTKALADKKSAQQTLIDLEAQRQKLGRIQEALPLLARRRQLQEGLSSLIDAPQLPEGFADERRKLAEDLAVAETSQRHAAQTLDELAKSAETLTAPQHLLARADTVQDLQTELGGHKKAARDRPGLEANLRQLAEEIGDLVRDLGRDADPAGLEQLRVPRSTRLRIGELGVEAKGLLAKLENAQEDTCRLSGEIARVERELVAVEPLRNADELRRILSAARRRGDLEQALATVRGNLNQKREQAALELKRLHPWSGTLAQLEALAVPSLETIDRWERDLAESHTVASESSREAQQAHEVARNLEHDIEKIRLQQDVPTEDDLATARRQRDEVWRRVRAAWEQPESTPAAGTAMGAESPVPVELARAYEQSVNDADHIADRLRREAERVAHKAHLMIDHRCALERAAELAARAGSVGAAQADCQARWQSLWLGILDDPGTPREMRAWATRQASVETFAREIGEGQAIASAAEAEIETLRAELLRCVAGLGEAVPASATSLSGLMQYCEELVEHIQERARARQQFERELAQQRERLPGAQEFETHAEVALADWRKKWAEAVAILGLGAEALPLEAGGILSATEELFSKRAAAEKLRERIEGIDRDSEQFAAKVVRTIEQLAPDLPPTPLEQAVVDLAQRLTAAQAAEARLKQIETQQKRQEAERDAAGQTVRELRSRLDSFCREANCQSPDELPAAERRSDARRDAQAELHRLDQDLLRLAAGASLEAFSEEAAAADPDELAPRIQALGEAVRERERELSQLDEVIIGERTEMRVMDTRVTAAEAAEANEMAEHWLARIRSDAQQYVRLKLASAVLQLAVQRYRERHQGPVLARASDIFAELTRGSFGGLRADYNEKGEAVLVGVRPGGKQTVGVGGMSDGTCDQMYLALRLASLEEFLKHNPPIPFIVDDILIKFDDDRAVAALQALAHLSQNTQVIFFTHHDHLVRLAKERLDPGVLFVHELKGGPCT